MCFVAVGFLKCYSQFGTDPSTKGKDAIKTGSSGFFPFCVCICCTIPLWIIAFVLMRNPNIFWPLFLVGCLIIFICIFGVGQSHIIIDRINNKLIKSTSGCFCIAYRRHIICSLSDIEKFYIVQSTKTRKNNENTASVDLFVGLRGKRGFKIINTEQRSVVIDKTKDIQNWWINNDFVSDYNVRFEFTQNIGNNDMIDDFQVFVVNVKLRNMQNGKMIDMAYELDKDKMISEYKILEKLTRTKDKLIELMVDKADTILKAKNVATPELMPYHPTAPELTPVNAFDDDANPVKEGERTYQ